MANLALQLKSYRLTLAEILYHMPDHPGVLQSFVWQDYDLSPRYPRLRQFLTFWERELDGPLHSVRISAAGLIQDSDLTHTRSEFLLN